MRVAHLVVLSALGAWACGDSGDSERAGGPSSEPTPSATTGQRFDAASDPTATVAAAATPAPAAVVEHPVFDLVDNRLLAHRLLDGGLYIDAGHASFPRYIRFHRMIGGARWKLDARVGDIQVAQPRRKSELVLTLDEAQANTFNTLTLRVHTREARNLRVAFNTSIKSKLAHSARLVTGWQTLTVPVPAGSLEPGINRIALRRSHGSPLSLAWAQLGPAPASIASAAPLYEPSADALRLGRDEAVAYHLFIPKGATLVGDVSGDGCSIDVTATTGDELHAGGSFSSGAAGGRVALGELSERVARLELRARGCASATVRAKLVVPGAPPKAHRAPPPKYVILWVMDTLRADKVRTITADARAEIPNLEKLAARGAVFRQYYVQGNESQTSHSSIWTSLYPANHRVITSGPATNYQLSNRFDALGKVMRRASYRTVGVTANGTITGWAGYTKGFDVFNNVMKDGTGRKLGFRVPADVLFERAMKKLGEPTGEPFFLFMGTTDNHKPWFGHEPWLSKYDPGPYKGRFKTKVLSSALHIPAGTHQCKWTPPPREMQRIHAIYDSAISFQDAQVGRLLQKLDSWGIADETMLIFTADHGEELWEYPFKCGHGSSLRETLVHVPLLVYYPPLIPRAVIDEGADGVDILPTIIDALGLDPIEQAQGQSLIPLTQGLLRGYPRPSYASMNDWSHTLRLGRWKGTATHSGVVRLHDHEQDPFERHDLAKQRPFELDLVRSAMALFITHRVSWKKSLWGVSSNMTARGAAELEGTWSSDETQTPGG